jgi:hypothetical protein
MRCGMGSFIRKGAADLVKSPDRAMKARKNDWLGDAAIDP